MVKPLDDRQFPMFARGQLRDEGMAMFRNGLRDMINPDTGLTFTEEEIAVVTAQGSYDWCRADALDQVLLSQGSRGVWLAEQADETRASTEWLDRFHGPRWGMPRLPAGQGSGTASGPCLVGATFVGSTTIPDGSAHYATSVRTGKKFQVLFTKTATLSTITLDFKAIDSGEDTNLAPGEVLRWAVAPTGSGDFVVLDRFRGGTPPEDDQAYGQRIQDRRRYRKAAGNRADWRGWAQEYPGVGTAYVYPCAYYGGSVHVCVLGKRPRLAPGATPAGPSVRVAPAGTLAAVASLLTSPGSRRVPGQPYILVTSALPVPTPLALQVKLPRGSAFGWTDPDPWPIMVSGVAPRVSAVSSQTVFQIRQTGCTAPAIASPNLMIWDSTVSRFRKLPPVLSVTFISGETWEITLASAPADMTIALNQTVSPDTERRDMIALAVEAYFDQLGPGEIIPSTDHRYARAHRFPLPEHQESMSLDSAVERFVEDALGVVGTINAYGLTTTTPGYVTQAFPVNPDEPPMPPQGPNYLTLGEVFLTREDD